MDDNGGRYKMMLVAELGSLKLRTTVTWIDKIKAEYLQDSLSFPFCSAPPLAVLISIVVV